MINWSRAARPVRGNRAHGCLDERGDLVHVPSPVHVQLGRPAVRTTELDRDVVAAMGQPAGDRLHQHHDGAGVVGHHPQHLGVARRRGCGHPVAQPVLRAQPGRQRTPSIGGRKIREDRERDHLQRRRHCLLLPGEVDPTPPSCQPAPARASHAVTEVDRSLTCASTVHRLRPLRGFPQEGNPRHGPIVASVLDGPSEAAGGCRHDRAPARHGSPAQRHGDREPHPTLPCSNDPNSRLSTVPAPETVLGFPSARDRSGSSPTTRCGRTSGLWTARPTGSSPE